MNDSILEQYDREKSLYSSFTTKISSLIVEILRENDIRVHSVTHRVKDRASLSKKLSKPDCPYSNLSDVTDIAGVRITTYLEDDVDKVARLLEHEFEIDQQNSGDKGALLDPDRFGYLSLHHVVSLTPERCRLVEYRRFPKAKAEVQTRSILQHAWAEIEHDLGYKSTQEVPREIRRRFSRLAGLLELADQEFISIKDELDAYESSVPEKIESAPQLVGIDKASLTAFLSKSELVKALDDKIAAFGKARIKFEEEPVANHVLRLKFFGIETMSGLETNLREHSKILLSIAEKWLTGSNLQYLNRGISIFYLGYALAARTLDAARIRNYIDKVMPLAPNKDKLVDRIVHTYEGIREN